VVELKKKSCKKGSHAGVEWNSGGPEGSHVGDEWNPGSSEGSRLGTHLFVKVPRPGDSEVTFAIFKSSCYLLLPVNHLS